MGANVFYYFMKWCELHHNESWVATHIESWVNVGGSLLGSIKGLSSLLSGEMKDSADMESVRAYVADKLISPTERVNMFRTWSSVASLLPKGGNAVWGSEEEGAPDEISVTGIYKHILSFTNVKHKNLTTEEAIEFLWKTMSEDELGDNVQKNLRKWYSLGVASNNTGFSYKPDSTLQDSKYWTNPLESPLPHAPNMKIYCLYGIGKSTERGYYYRDQHDYNSRSPPLFGLRFTMDTIQDTSGVKLGDGDGTIPLLSLGYMCVEGWKNKFYNPSELKVYTREYVHTPSNALVDPRGGPGTGDHVDIMGNHQLIDDILSILTGSTVDEDVIYSPIKNISTIISERIRKISEK